MKKCKNPCIQLTLAIVMFSLTAGAQNKAIKSDKPNVLFIAVDDLRPELGCYGKTHIKSPNIDQLAKSGIIFTNAYCNYPVCGPSRASLLSGIYPGKNRFLMRLENGKWNCILDKYVPGIVSLPMHFRNNGYETISLGKIFHNFEDGKGSWIKKWVPPTHNIFDYQSVKNIKIIENENKNMHKDISLKTIDSQPTRGSAYEKLDIPDIAYKDGRITYKAIEELQKFQNNQEPFFLAIGFYKPHLPFNAPQKYWEIYDEKNISLPSNYFFSKDAPNEASFNWGELRRYNNIPSEGPVTDSIAYNLIHGYYACVSYIDAQIGLILNELEDLGLADNTIIILWGDHGWFLGEHGFWSKHSNFRGSSHAPLILKVPWEKSGLKIESLVEFIDIYPTLCELAKLSLPIHLQGKSLVSLIENPGQLWDNEVFYRHSGETIVTQTHSYTEWINYETKESYARMLFDLRIDPEENINVAELPENKRLINELHQKLHYHILNRDKLIIP